MRTKMIRSKPGELRFAYIDHTEQGKDFYTSWEAPARKVDANYLLWMLCDGHYGPMSSNPEKSFVKELESRGYDLSTLEFTIKMKE